MLFYRQRPATLPPSGSNLLAWMDANDITDLDGASVSSMPNKGTLGGDWNTGAFPSPNAPLAATVDSRRALSFPSVWPSGSPQYGYSNSTFNFPAVAATQGVTLLVLAKQQQAWDPFNVPTFYFAEVGGDSGLSMYVNLTSAPPSFQGRFRTTQPSQTGGAFSATYAAASQLPGEFAAYGTQLSTTITNNQSFFQLRQNATDFDTTSDGTATGIVGTNSGPVKIGGSGNGTYSFSGWIREVLVWNTLVSQADIKTYLDSKYGGTW
jgi:hypothetical protein